MKNTIKTLFGTLYNPSFYKGIDSISLRNIFIYMLKVDLILTIILTIYEFISVITKVTELNNLPTTALVISLIMALISLFISKFLTIYIIWLLYGWVWGLVILTISTIFRRKIIYTHSVKIAIYSMSLPIVLMMFPSSQALFGIALIVPVIIVLINLKKRSV